MKPAPRAAARLASMPVAATSILAVTAASCVLLTTRWGIGTSPDSVGYLQAARTLVATGGRAIVTGDASSDVALTHFAPLYSFMLATGAVLGMDPYDWARWLNALLMGANVLVLGLLLRASLGRVGWLWGAGMVIAVASMPILVVHVTMLSEPLFLLLTCLGLWWLSRYLGGMRSADLILAAVAFGLAWLTRYAGASGVIAGGLALLGFRGRPPIRRVRDAALLGTVASAGILMWLARNAVLTSSATGRELVFHPIGRSHAWQGLYTVSSWLMIPASAPDWVRLGTWGILAAVVVWTIVAMRRDVVGIRRNSRASLVAGVPVVVQMLALFAVVYLGFLALSISLFDANTPMDDRILSPVYLAGLVLALWILRVAGSLASLPRSLTRLAAAGLATFVGVQCVQGARLVAAGHARGWGFSSLAWQSSPTLDRVRQLPESVAIYSNAPEVVYLHTGRRAEALPKPWLPMNRQPNPDYQRQVAAMRESLHGRPSVLVMFHNLRGGLPARGEPDIVAELSLNAYGEQADGLILCAACPR